MNRRSALVGCLALLHFALSSASDAQTMGGLPRVVIISLSTPELFRPLMDSFLAGMRENGQVDGRTFRLDVKYSGEVARVAAVIRETIARPPAVIVVAGLTAARHARDATSTIPVVVATSSDLVDAGVVRSLARPGGNITGVSDLTDETTVKRLEFLKAVLPTASRVALLLNPDSPATAKVETRVASAAASLRIAVERLYARDSASLALAMSGMKTARPEALLVAGDPLFNQHAGDLIDAATAIGVPVFHYWPGTAERGALLSYEADILDNFRRAAGYVDKILKGAKPGELPIFQPTRYELVVNARVARALGLSVPQDILVRATRVIE